MIIPAETIDQLFNLAASDARTHFAQAANQVFGIAA
jgi:hypothetical protein